MVISTLSKQMAYLSPCCIGKRHDYRFLKEEFPPEQGWFQNFRVEVDLGYLGIARDYLCKSIGIPHKKPKNGVLNQDQKNENKELSSERVIVEQSIGGLKRYRVLSDRLRLHHLDLYDNILGVCAGLWNFYLATQPADL